MSISRNPVLAVLTAVCGWTSADPILQTNPDSLTTFKPASGSAVQDVRPLAVQRGVGLDGTLRAGAAFGWALQANPFENGSGAGSFQGIMLASGAYEPFEVDLALPAEVPWVVGRTFNARQATSGGSHRDSDGYQGKNWFQVSQPELVFFDNDSNAGTREAEDLVYLVYGADRYVEFQRTDDDEDTFRGVNGAAGVFEYEAGSPDIWVYYDQVGNRTYFFGGNTSSGRADWQIWKFVNPAGDVAYVGNETTATTAVSSGFNADGQIILAFDSAGREFTYTYTTIDGTSRLTYVSAELGSTVVGEVQYDYYADGDTEHGTAGNLKLVTTVTPLSDGTSNLLQRQYYRYYTGAYEAGNWGYHDTIKLVLGNEGCRRYDWDIDGYIAQQGEEDELEYTLTTTDDDDLKSYADVYFEYDTSYRVSSVFFNGECGCSGGINGIYNLSYDDNPSFSGSAGYDTAWFNRVVIEPPSGGAWSTQYLDEVGQPLSTVVSDADPSGTAGTWVTPIVRNSSGQITEIHTPANVTGYTHNTNGSPDGAITTSSTVGPAWYLERVSTGDAAGLLQGRRQKAGSGSLSTSSTFVSWMSYATRDLNIATGVNVTRPVISAERSYHTATTDASGTGTFDQTTMSYAWWETSTSTDVLYITPKQIETQAPAVAADENGSGSATSTNHYLRKDGTTAFTASARGVVTYTAYTNGLLSKRIEDANTSTGTTYDPSSDHPNSVFGIASFDGGVHRQTEFSYDLQGRLTGESLPTGRQTKRWYDRLGDERMVMFNIPRVETGLLSSLSYYGPVQYTVGNHAGLTEDCLLVNVEGSTTSLDSWIVIIALTGRPPSDPIAALAASVGPVSRWTASRYDNAGRRLLERRVFHTIPDTQDEADEGIDYDAWRVGYDNLGRQTRVKEPSYSLAGSATTATISRTDYDVLGRVTATYVGTNDSSFSGGEPSGTDDMVKTEEMEYDGGSTGGNSHLTSRTLFVEDGTTGQRVTEHMYDYRGRLVATINPEPPFSVTAYDNEDRVVASALYTDHTNWSTSLPDPVSTSSNRVALSQTFYDARGQVWKSQRHKIDQSDGSDDDQSLTLNWYDPDGRLIKSDGEQLTKTRYDRLGRVFQVFTLATDDDAAETYSDVYDASTLYADLDGDKVLEEVQRGYDDENDRVLVEGRISRKHGDTTTTGPLDVTYDSGGDDDSLKFTAADVMGRIQITAYWHDELDRVRTTAHYGTNDATDNVATFDRDGLSEPTSSSASMMVTKSVYAGDGTVEESVDALGRSTVFGYDKAGRLVATIGNYTGGSLANAVRDHDVYTRYAYEQGRQRYIWVDTLGDDTDGVVPDGTDPDDDDDQITEYVYGTTAGTVGSGTPVQSAIGTAHLLYQVKYPKQDASQADADRTVTYAYNAQGEQVWTQDQEGNVVQTAFDEVGREIHRRVTNPATGFDSTVLRISTTYLDRGLVDKITQYNNATVGSGAVVDDLRYTYDDWGNIESFIQDVDSEIGGTAYGRDSFQVGYTYAKATTGRNTIRRTKTTLPGDTAVTYSFLSTSGKLDDAASRVSRVSVAVGPPGNPPPVSVMAAEYEYLGAAFLVGTDLLEPSARWEYFEGASGTNPYPDLDPFNRVQFSRWTGYKASGTRDFYDVDITYDNGSNITSIEDEVHKNASSQPNFDALYTLDELNRLIRAEEGTLDLSGPNPAITNPPSRDERWLDSSDNLGLSQTGNWLYHRLDLDGDGSYTNSGERDEENTFNLPNELFESDIHGDASVVYEPIYDKNGNLVDDDQNYEYVYDAFGRLRKVYATGTSDLVAEYTYNGLGFRIGWHSDVTDDGTTGEPDGVVDGDDPWYWFCYDDGWRIVATFRAADEDPKEVFVHHNAGLGGRGSSSYIDSVILRDRDAGTGWAEQADSTREERVYYCQNWRADVVALLSDAGKMLEWTKYSAYGVPFALPAGDIDSDGDFDATDVAGTTGAYDVRKDSELDGDVDFNDIYHAAGIAGAYQTLGRGVLTSPAIDNRRGYAGYESDPTFAGANGGGANARTIYHVRHRVYDADVGRWTRRDPLGYSDGMSLYSYVQGLAIIRSDLWGLCGNDLTSYASHANRGSSSSVPSSPCQDAPQAPSIPWCFAENPNPNPTPSDCCAAMRATDCAKDKHPLGYVVCCQGEVVSCIHHSPPVWIPKPGEGEKYLCVYEHENYHRGRTNCLFCEKWKGQVCLMGTGLDLDPATEECAAHKIGLACLENAKVKKCNEYPRFRDRVACRQYLETEQRSVCERIRLYCPSSGEPDLCKKLLQPLPGDPVDGYY